MKRFIFIAVAALALALAGLPQAEALVRPTHTIARAIGLSAPWVSKPLRLAYARILQAQGKKRHFDPLTMIAIVHFESHWNASLVNANPPREYSVGLAQINVLANRRACRAQLDSPKCQAAIGSLMNGSHNLKAAASLISLTRAYCRRRTGKPALFARWLSLYQGYDSRRGVVCNQRKDRRGRWRDLPTPKKTRLVMRYRRELIRRLRI